MLDLENTPHHISVDEIATVLCNRIGKSDPSYFRILTIYYLSIIAGCMRAKVVTKDLKEVALNNYLLALAPSGYGKGKSCGILENECMLEFRQNFTDGVMPNKVEQNLWKLASQRAAIMIEGNDNDEYKKLKVQHESKGEYPFVFDGGSEPAIKEVRELLLLSGCGSINMQVDEFGSNLEKNSEAFNTYLELYDQGRIKPKVKMNSNENKRMKEILGSTPANLLGFGTPLRVMDSGPVEKRFFSLLETGMARRCLFAYGDVHASLYKGLTNEEIFAMRIDPQNEQALLDWSSHFATLADVDKLDWLIEVPDEVSIELIGYQQWCEQRAAEMPNHHEIQKTEMIHRYFKALKIAGVYAFVEESLTMTMQQLHSAIKLVEESGVAFTKLMKREPPYVKLARYIAREERELTHADLDEELSFYKGTRTEKQDMMSNAVAWGYKNNIIIQRAFVDGIEFFTGDTLKETDLDEIGITWSDDFAYRFRPEVAAFNQMHLLTQAPDLHWANHSFEGQHRAEENVIPGFNLIVLDIDSGVHLETVHELFADYTFMTYTTKRHTPDAHRFRLLLPMSYHLNLDKDDYAQFMKNICKWLPFDVDEAANQRSRKWQTFDQGSYHYNLATKDTQNLLDVLPFIPKTSKNEKHQKDFAALSSLDSLERWFAQHFEDIGRNNQMIKYALALMDAGFSQKDIENKVTAFNKKMPNGLTTDELRSTVFQTVAKRMVAKAA